MKRIYIEHYTRLGVVNFYTVRFDGTGSNETDIFIRRYRQEDYLEDLEIIKIWLQILGKKGAAVERFRPEKNVYAGPSAMCRLRIYCIRCNTNIVILGGGGVKKGAKTQDGAETKKWMELMIKIDMALVRKITEGGINYSASFRELQGNLFIDI